MSLYDYTFLDISTNTTAESNEDKEIHRLNQLFNEKNKEIAFLKNSDILCEKIVSLANFSFSMKENTEIMEEIIVMKNYEDNYDNLNFGNIFIYHFVHNY